MNLKQTILNEAEHLTRNLTVEQRSMIEEGLPPSCPRRIRNLIVLHRCGVNLEHRQSRRHLSRAAIDQMFASTAAAIIAKVDQEQEQNRRSRRRNLLSIF